jgi:hypothetical protein
MQGVRRLLVLCGVAFGACGRGAEPKPEGGQAAGGTGEMQRDSGGTAGHMNMESMRMVPTLRAHLDSMMSLPPARMSQMMAGHERTMSRMMDRMGSDMRGMNMAADARWTALSDSVKVDLSELPGLQGQALSERMKAHGDRVRRLLVMHESMMKDM